VVVVYTFSREVSSSPVSGRGSRIQLIQKHLNSRHLDLRMACSTTPTAAKNAPASVSQKVELNSSYHLVIFIYYICRMKIKTKIEPKAKIKLVAGSAFAIETAPHLPSMHQVNISIAKRGSFKTTAVSNLLRMYKETGTLDRCLIISPTFFSNRKLMEQLGINEEDVFTDPDEVGLIEKIIAICDEERDAFVQWKQDKIKYDEVMKRMKSGYAPITDEHLLQFYDPATNTFKMPNARYPCYHKGRPPVLAAYFDDILGSKVANHRSLVRLVQMHRHISALPEGGAVGISLFFSIQSFKSQNGLNRAIRNQITSALVGRTKDRDEAKQIAESFAGEISPELFHEVHHMATKDSKHDFLFVDLHPKSNHPSQFRKNFDEFMIVETGENNNVGVK
jgi:hypothetical protein